MSAHSQLGHCFLIAAAALLLAACPGSSPSSRTKTDAGHVTIPGATDDPTPTYADGGATPAADDSPGGSFDGGAVTGTWTCQQIEQCMAACNETDDACYQGCYDKGSAAAQAQEDAINECWYGAFEGSCKSKCTTESQACYDCCDSACQAQFNACQ